MRILADNQLPKIFCDLSFQQQNSNNKNNFICVVDLAKVTTDQPLLTHTNIHLQGLKQTEKAENDVLHILLKKKNMWEAPVECKLLSQYLPRGKYICIQILR